MKLNWGLIGGSIIFVIVTFAVAVLAGYNGVDATPDPRLLAR